MAYTTDHEASLKAARKWNRFGSIASFRAKGAGLTKVKEAPAKKTATKSAPKHKEAPAAKKTAAKKSPAKKAAKKS